MPREPAQRRAGGKPEEARARHAQLRRAAVDPGDQAFRQVDVHPLGRVRRIDADNEVGDEVAALRHHDPLDRRRLGQRSALLEQLVHRLRQRGFGLADGLLLRFAAGDAARKIGKPGAERVPRAALQNRRIDAVFIIWTAADFVVFNTPRCVISHTSSMDGQQAEGRDGPASRTRHHSRGLCPADPGGGGGRRRPPGRSLRRDRAAKTFSVRRHGRSSAGSAAATTCPTPDDGSGLSLHRRPGRHSA